MGEDLIFYDTSAVAAHFPGPALINTAMLIGLADSLGGIAFYTFLSAYAILTHR